MNVATNTFYFFIVFKSVKEKVFQWGSRSALLEKKNVHFSLISFDHKFQNL